MTRLRFCVTPTHFVHLDYISDYNKDYNSDQAMTKVEIIDRPSEARWTLSDLD